MDVMEANYSEYYAFGRDYFGPFLLGFTRWIETTARSNDVEKLLFFARDGFMMEKAYEEMGYELPHQYVYFSRKSLRQALLYRCSNYEDSLKYLTKERFVSIEKILSYYGLTAEEQRNTISKFALKVGDELAFGSLMDNDRLKEVYETYETLIKERSLQQAKLLKQYLFQIGIKSKCAIIDIGWHGSMQFYLEQFANNENINVSIIGLYVGIKPIEQLKGNVFGYTFYPDNLQYRKRVMCFHGGYEKLFQSLEGSTLGYKDVNGVVEPVLAVYEYNGGNNIRIINEWQQGALQFVRVNKQISKNDIELISPLIKMGSNPTYKQTMLFKDFFLKDGQSQAFVSQKGLFQYKPKELLHALSASVWKTGFMKSVFKLPFPYFLVYSIIRK